MSAFLFLATTQPVAPRKKTQGRRKTSRDNSTIRSDGSSRASLSSSNSYLAATTSLVSTSSTDSESKKMVYDINTSKYVTKSSKQTPVERKISTYNSSLRKLSRRCSHNEINEALNKYLLEDKSDKLFTKQQVNILRYTYFHKFTAEVGNVEKLVSKRKTDGNYKLKYMRKLKKIHKLQANSNSDNRSRLPSPTSLTIDTDEESDMSSSEEPRSLMPKRAQEESLENIYQQYTQFASLVEKTEKPEGIREIIKSTQFWNDVYQDLKFEFMQEKAVNFFDMLPTIHQTKEFFGELMDYFLYNLCLIECSPREITKEDLEKLEEYKHFYFEDSDFEFFGSMSALHHKTYTDQSSIFSSLNSPISVGFSPVQSKFNLDQPSEEERIHNRLMEKVIEIVIENLKGTLHGKRNTKGFKDLFNIWSSFLKYLLFDLMSKDKYPNDDILPEPTIEEQIEDEPIIKSTSQEENSVRPKNLKIKIMRSGSITSKTINKAAVYGDHPNHYTESFQSSQASSASNNSIDGFYSHHNGEDTDATTAPSSPSFISNSDKSYNSKKATKSKKLSLFGKFKK